MELSEFYLRSIRRLQMVSLRKDSNWYLLLITIAVSGVLPLLERKLVFLAERSGSEKRLSGLNNRCQVATQLRNIHLYSFVNYSGVLFKTCEEACHLILMIDSKAMLGYAVRLIRKVFLIGLEDRIALRILIFIGEKRVSVLFGTRVVQVLHFGSGLSVHN